MFYTQLSSDSYHPTKRIQSLSFSNALIPFYEHFLDPQCLFAPVFIPHSGTSPTGILRLSFSCRLFFSESSSQIQRYNMNRKICMDQWWTLLCLHVSSGLFLILSEVTIRVPCQLAPSWSFLWSLLCLLPRNLFCLIFSFSHLLTGFSVSGRYRNRHYEQRGGKGCSAGPRDTWQGGAGFGKLTEVDRLWQGISFLGKQELQPYWDKAQAGYGPKGSLRKDEA